jgi:hypothetical protein
MNRRSPTDLCLLCKKTAADKRSSHIIPKMMTKKMFGTPARGYVVTTHKNSHSRMVQDSAKENYILCTSCEARFEKVETYIARRFFLRYRNPAYKVEFPITPLDSSVFNGLDIMTLLQVDRGMMRLFVYSILWRSSISSVEELEAFNLASEIEEQLRNELDCILTSTEQATLINCEQYSKAEPIIPYMMVTCVDKMAVGENFLTVGKIKDGKVYIMANDFMLYYYLPGAMIPYPSSANLGLMHPQVDLLDLQSWRHIKSVPLQFLNKAKEQVKRGG